MSSPTLSGMFALGVDVLGTTLSTVTKALVALVGDVHSGTSEATDVEWWQQVGFVSRPPLPKAGNSACQVVTIRQGNRDIAIASRDLRGLDLIGNLKDGETCVYAPGPDGTAQARVLLKDDGSISLYTRKDNSPTGTGMLVSVVPNSNTITLLNASGHGIIIDDDGVKITAKGSALTLEAAGGISMIGTGQVAVDGASILLGATASAATGVGVGPGTPVVVLSTKVFAAVA